MNVFIVDNHTGTGQANLSSIAYRSLPIANNDTYVIDTEKIILANAGTGDFIAANVGGHANASGNVAMTISYASV